VYKIWKRFEKIHETFWKDSRNVLERFTKCSEKINETFWKDSRNVLERFTKCSEKINETFWKRTQDVLKRFSKSSKTFSIKMFVKLSEDHKTFWKRLQSVLKRITRSSENVQKTFSIKTFSIRSQTKRSQNIHKTFSTERSLHTRFPTLVSPLGYTRFERFIKDGRVRLLSPSRREESISCTFLYNLILNLEYILLQKILKLTSCTWVFFMFFLSSLFRLQPQWHYQKPNLC
jgi:hypothetical protein